MWYVTGLILMMRSKRAPDDDGRVIASMLSAEEQASAPSSSPEDAPAFTSTERRLYALAALKAALLIGTAFLGGLAFVIWLITLL
jgi:hypothetical protein